MATTSSPPSSLTPPAGTPTLEHERLITPPDSQLATPTLLPPAGSAAPAVTVAVEEVVSRPASTRVNHIIVMAPRTRHTKPHPQPHPKPKRVYPTRQPRGPPPPVVFYPSPAVSAARHRPATSTKPAPTPLTSLWGRPLTINMVRNLQKPQVADLLEAGFLAKRTLEGTVWRERQLAHRGVHIQHINPHPLFQKPIVVPTKFTGPTSSYLNIPIEQDICRLYTGYPGVIPHRFIDGRYNQAPHAPVISLPLDAEAQVFEPRTGFYVYRHPLSGISGPEIKTNPDGTPVHNLPPTQTSPRDPNRPVTPDLASSRLLPDSPQDACPTTPKKRLNPHCSPFRPGRSLDMPPIDWVDVEPPTRHFSEIADQRTSTRGIVFHPAPADELPSGLLPPFELNGHEPEPNTPAEPEVRWHPNGPSARWAPSHVGTIATETVRYRLYDNTEGEATITRRHRLLSRPHRIREEVKIRYHPRDRRILPMWSAPSTTLAPPPSRRRSQSLAYPVAPMRAEGKRVSSLNWKYIKPEMLGRKLCDGFCNSIYVPPVPEHA